jgi:pSer/pThr/pTyr-binding forkhead associated (FHA) protein
VRVVVEITSGPAAGKKFRIEAGQMLQVGRTEWADYAIPGDIQMSSVHFALEADYENCYVKDLGSTNGTFLNRQRIAVRCPLQNGDAILAGQTDFVVRIEANRESHRDSTTTLIQTPPMPGPTAAVVRPLPSETSRPRAKMPSFTAEPCDSGLTLYRGSVDEIAPADLAVLLCQVYPAYLIVDFKNLGSPRPAELVDPSYLFDWFAPPVAELASPVIVGQEDLLSWPKLIEEGWGNDAVVCLFSPEDKATVVSHLRHAVRKNPAGAPEEGILGLCWPSVLGSLLMHCSTQYVAPLLHGVSAVLFEFTDLPETWQIFGSSEIGRHLEELGLKPSAPQEKG